MKNKKILILALLPLLLGGCSTIPLSSDSSSSTVDSSTNTSESSSNKEEQSSEETSTPSSSNSVSSSEETSSSEASSSEVTSSSQSQSSSEEDFDYNPHEGLDMPNGFEYVEMPKNIQNPLNISDWQNFDCTESVPTNWSYIYGNNITRGDFYHENNGNIGLKFADAGRAIQTPAFMPSNKVEIRLHLTIFHGTDVKRPENHPETFTVYGFDENQDIIYTKNYTPTKGTDPKKATKVDLKFYIEGNPNVRYAQIRFNERMFNTANPCKYINVGATELSLKSHIAA